MMRSRLAGLPSFDSSFQLVEASTPSSRGVLASSMAWPAMFSASPRFIDAPARASQRADFGTKNSCSSRSPSTTSRATPDATAFPTSSSKRSESRFKKRMEKM